MPVPTIGAWARKEPECKARHGEERHSPVLNHAEASPQPGVVEDELIDGVVDAVVHAAANLSEAWSAPEQEPAQDCACFAAEKSRRDYRRDTA